MTKTRTHQSLSRLLMVAKGQKMTVEELKKLINLSSNDSIVYRRNDERVEPKNTDTVASISATGDWDGFVQYNIELGQ